MRALWIATALSFVVATGWTFENAQAEHHEGGPKVMQVFTIDHQAKDRAAVLARFKALQDIAAKEGVPAFRAWLGTYAGDNTGRLFVTVEQDNYATFGAGQAKVLGSAAITKWLDDINKSGLATVVSQSLLLEVTP